MSLVPAGFDPQSFRWGSSSAPSQETLVIVLAIAAMALACALLLVRSLRRRARRPPPVRDQWRALAVMGELCPRGWQARIRLYGGTAPMPADAPRSAVPLVELEWRGFDGRSQGVEQARRLWAPTIERALEMMAEERRADVAIARLRDPSRRR